MRASDPRCDEEGIEIFDINQKMIAFIPYYRGGEPMDQDHKDEALEYARLFARAPQLLRGVLALLDAAGYSDGLRGLLNVPTNIKRVLFDLTMLFNMELTGNYTMRGKGQ